MIIDNLKLKPIPNYEDYYWANYDGRILSVRSKKWLKPSLRCKNKLYLQVSLYKDNKEKKINVHRLIASVWIPNPKNLPCINHIDENPQNNCVSNLEWCTAEYNINYGSRNKRASETKRNNPNGSNRAGVRCIETGEQWNSITACAAAIGCSKTNVQQSIKKRCACLGRHFERITEG